MKPSRFRSSALLASAAFFAAAALAGDLDPVEQSCDAPDSLKAFVFSDPNAWQHGKDDDGKGFLELHQQSKYKTKVRSPFNIALLSGQKFGSFTLEAELLQTGKDYGHRDMCVFFGFQDPSHFYYTHIATKTDDHAHNIFIVNDQPRTKISTKTTDGFDWGRDAWQKVRLVRDAESGKIEVFVNDMDKPMMVAEDKTFAEGFVGFGSFDDTGRVRNIRITPKSKPAAAEADFFKGKE